jgi:hypothetical protein
MQGNITLDRQAYQAMQFLKLQGETKDWIEAVTGKSLKSNGDFLFVVFQFRFCCSLT